MTQLIQFEGRTVAVIAPEDLEAMERELDALRDNALRVDLDCILIEQREREAVELVESRAEITRLRAQIATLAEAGTGYSQQTVDAITAERETLRAERDALAKHVARLRKGLQFYANGTHFHGESDWDDVSGEPPNWMCNEYGDTVEDGSVAKMVLAGVDLAETGDLFDKPPA